MPSSCQAVPVTPVRARDAHTNRNSANAKHSISKSGPSPGRRVNPLVTSKPTKSQDRRRAKVAAANKNLSVTYNGDADAASASEADELVDASLDLDEKGDDSGGSEHYETAADSAEDDDYIVGPDSADSKPKAKRTESSNPKTLVRKQKASPVLNTSSAIPVIAARTKVRNNGRHVGRQLIRWSAAADQLLMLCMQYEIYKAGLVMPWKAIAERFAAEKNPTSQCLIQHLSKLRAHMLDSGRWVPPLMGRKEQVGMSKDLDVRGNVRYLKDGRPEIRDVGWHEDLSMLVNPADIDPLPATRTPGGRKLRADDTGNMRSTNAKNSISGSTKYTPGSAARRRQNATPTKSRGSKTKEEIVSDSEASEEYAPRYTDRRRSMLTRTTVKKNRRLTRTMSSDSDDEDEDNSVQQPSPDSVKKRRQAAKDFARFNTDEEEEYEAYCNETKIVILKIGKENAKQIADGRFGEQDYAAALGRRSMSVDSQGDLSYVRTPTKALANPYDLEHGRDEDGQFVVAVNDDPFIDHATSLVDDATPFDDHGDYAAGENRPAVPSDIADGFRYSAHLTRIITNFNTALIDTATAKMLWRQEIAAVSEAMYACRGDQQTDDDSDRSVKSGPSTIRKANLDSAYQSQLDVNMAGLEVESGPDYHAFLDSYVEPPADIDDYMASLDTDQGYGLQGSYGTGFRYEGGSGHEQYY